MKNLPKMCSPQKRKKSCSPLMIRKMRFPHPRKKPCCFPMMYFRCRKPSYYAITLGMAVAIWAAFRFGLGVSF